MVAAVTRAMQLCCEEALADLVTMLAALAQMDCCTLPLSFERILSFRADIEQQREDVGLWTPSMRSVSRLLAVGGVPRRRSHDVGV